MSFLGLVESREEVAFPRQALIGRQLASQFLEQSERPATSQRSEEHPRLEPDGRNRPNEPARSAHYAGERQEHGAEREPHELERVFTDGFFDAVQEGLPELGKRELGLNLRDVDCGNGLLNATDDRDLANL